MKIKFYLFAVSFLVSLSAHASTKVDLKTQCEVNYNKLNSLTQIRQAEFDNFREVLNKFNWLNKSTIESIRQGAVNEVNTFGKLYPIVKQFQNTGNYQSCINLSSLLIDASNLVGNMITSSQKSIIDSQSEFPTVQKKFNCSSETQCSPYYDAVAQYKASLDISKYQQKIEPILKKIQTY